MDDYEMDSRLDAIGLVDALLDDDEHAYEVIINASDDPRRLRALVDANAMLLAGYLANHDRESVRQAHQQLRQKAMTDGDWIA